MATGRVGNYELGLEIGQGRTGVVHRAEDMRHHRTVAVELLSPDLTSDLNGAKRFRRDATLASRFEHPNILPIHEVGKTKEGQYYVVMPYHEGESLTRMIEQGPLDISSAVDIIRQTAQGLAWAHKYGIVHGNLTPSSIMITPRGAVTILGFGKAHLLVGAKLTLDTVPYMSPDQIRGDRPDVDADIWALGAILYRMLTGRLPFPGRTVPDICDAIGSSKVRAEDPRRIRQDIPADVSSLCMRCIQKDDWYDEEEDQNQEENEEEKEGEESKQEEKAEEKEQEKEQEKEEKKEEATEEENEERFDSMDQILRLLGGQPVGGKKHPLLLLQSRIREHKVKAGILLLAVAGILVWLIVANPFVSHPSEAILVVFPFHGAGDDTATANWGPAIQSMLVGELTGHHDLGVIDPLTLTVLLKDSVAVTAPRTSILVEPWKSRISLFLEGLVVKDTNHYTIRANLTDPRDGAFTHTETAEVRQADSLSAAVARISGATLAYIRNTVLDKPEPPPAWMQYRPQNIEAILAFRRASEHVLRYADDAERTLRSAVALDSQYALPRIWLASLLIHDERMDEAQAHYEALDRMRKQGLVSSFEYDLIGWLGACIAGDASDQTYALRSAMECSPGNPLLYFGVDRGAVGVYELTGEADVELAKTFYSYAAPQIYESEEMIEKRHFKAARSTLEKLDEAARKSTRVQAMRCFLASVEGDSATARRLERDCLAACRQQGKTPGYAYAVIGNFWAAFGNLPQAERYFRMAVSSESRNVAYRLKLAEVLCRRGKVKARELEALLVTVHANAQAHLLLGETWEKEMDYPDAVRHFGEYLRLSPDLPYGDTMKSHVHAIFGHMTLAQMQALLHLQSAEEAEESEHFDEAEHEYREYLRLSPNGGAAEAVRERLRQLEH